MRQLLSLCLLGLCPAIIFAADVEEGFTTLFDGKSLAGWEGDEKTFRVADGAIVAGTLEAKIPRNEFLCSKKEYGNFELRLQARLKGAGENAGIQFRSARIPNHHEVKGYQCDMGNMPGRTIWGSLYDESRRNKFLAHGDDAEIKKALHADDWNDITIRCEGKKIQIWVNGVKSIDYQEMDEGIAERGIIGLQIHGGAPAESAYRKIRIREL
jgi:hypothetical protein